MSSRYVAATIRHAPSSQAGALAHASSWTWFDDMALVSANRGRDEANAAFEDMRERGHDDHMLVEALVSSLSGPEVDATRAAVAASPFPMIRARSAFEKMIVERYIIQTNSHGSVMGEPAKAALDQFLSDSGLQFGDPSLSWNRDLANEIADGDIAVWNDFV